ncbi:MAG TPA: hypothetical protein VG500_05600 [Gemmatimonadales bacterium]|nr:hypothetical protein [Gemmatimonadales bacterium]
MRLPALRRLKALVLTAVLLIGGSGVSALDLALYHLGGGVEAASHRISGTDAPRPHADDCALLDWTARGPYTVSLSPPLLQPVDLDTDRSRPIRACPPRAADLVTTTRPRAPPVPLV